MLDDARSGKGSRLTFVPRPAVNTLQARAAADASLMLRTSCFGGARGSPFFLAAAAIDAKLNAEQGAGADRRGSPEIPASRNSFIDFLFSLTPAPAVGTAYSFGKP